MNTVACINALHCAEAPGELRQPLEAGRLAKAKAAFTTRRAPLERAALLLAGDLRPQPGDLVLARVTRLGQHRRLELETGRRAPMFIGDEILVCYGHRYAPDQFEAEVPEDLGPCHLVAAGGIASLSRSRNARIKNATQIEPIGLVADARGERLNLSRWALDHSPATAARPTVIAVVGTAMNAGKTTSAAHLIHGLAGAGLNVGAAKITGTGAGGDVWLMRDAGAFEVVDFTDAGYASTYRMDLDTLEEVAEGLIGHLERADSDVIVVEIADGLYQGETAALLLSPVFRRLVDGLIFAAGDAMGACAGVQWLSARELRVVAASGAFTAAPLAVREAAQFLPMPILGLDQLSDPDGALQVVHSCQVSEAEARIARASA